MEDARLWEAVRPDDGFHLKLRRQGWHLTGCKPVYNDPQVIRVRAPIALWATNELFPDLYAALGSRTVRKLLRALLEEPRTYDSLTEMCSNTAKLNGFLSYLQARRIVSYESFEWNIWRAGTACDGIRDIGPTLEWYVAEWFRQELQAAARHGITIQEVPSGEMDVVAFVEGIRVFVECKSGKPSNVTEVHLRHFLQRAEEFNPEIAVLLLDTESDIEKTVVEPLRGVLSDLAMRDGFDEDDLLVAAHHVAIEPQPRYAKSLYWGARNIYVTNVSKGMGESLDAVLRHYYAHARHQPIPARTCLWNFITGEVKRTKPLRFKDDALRPRTWVARSPLDPFF